MKLIYSSKTSGVALVTTVIVIAVLAVVAVAFMQSTSMDRLSSRTVKTYFQGQLSADGATAAATDLLVTLMNARPFYATGSDLDSQQNARPIFIGAVGYNDAPDIFYLMSSSTSSPPVAGQEGAVDINGLGGPGGDHGWIGSPIKKVDNVWQRAPQSVVAEWINILQDSTQDEQPNPSLANYNPVIARYAFWVEDETARLDVTVAGNDASGGGFERVSEQAFSLESSSPIAGDFRSGRGPSELDIGALPLTGGRPLPANERNLNRAVVEFMSDTRELPPDLRRIAFVDAVDFDDVKFHTTAFSVSNELAGTGRRRVNLNHLVTDSADPDVIAADLDDIIYVITGRHVFSDSDYHTLSNEAHQGVFLDQPQQQGPMPDFGSRFYTSPALGTGERLKEDHASVYLLKLAANIRDYVDQDSQPTFVDFSGEVIAGQRVETSWLSGEEPIALGKEAIPYLQEHAWRAKLNNVEIVEGTNPSNRRSVSFTMDHYFEVYNPALKDWLAPDGTILKVYNLPSFEANQFPAVQLPDLELDLSGIVFPAGTAVILTTAPDVDDPEGLLQPGARVERLVVPASAREFNNVIGNRQVGSGLGDSRRFGIRMLGRTSPSTDYETEIVLTTNEGVLDAYPFLTLAGTGSPFEMTLSANGQAGTWTLPPRERDNQRFIWAHSLRGNDAPSRSGDPRSLSEPLQLVAGSADAFGNDQARFFMGFSGLSGASLPGFSTFGNPAISYVQPANWPDYHVALANTANSAYAVVADRPMRSIGELGHIYDPHRKLDPESDFGIGTARGGGRTLKIGQPDDLVGDGARFSAAGPGNVSWFNGAWRLTDIFSAEDPDVAVSAPAARGKININGVMRDGGTAFRAVLRALTFNPSPLGDTGRAGGLLTEDEIDTLIGQIEDYLQSNGPMMCRGELGQLPFFRATGQAGTAGGQASSVTIDRGREEIFRRIVELITTRSLAFRIYAVGQAVRQDAAGNIRPESTAYRESVILLNPVIGDGPNDVVSGYLPQVVYSMEL